MVALFINTYDDEEELLTQMQEISREFLHRHMINVNIISYRAASDTVQAHTFYPYDDDNCATDVTKLHQIEECKYSDENPYDPQILIRDPLRAKIPNNLHDCELRIVSSVLEPFVFYDKETDEFNIGTEVLMTRTIAQSLKMKPIFIRINETRENRLVSNESGIYSKLLSQ